MQRSTIIFVWLGFFPGPDLRHLKVTFIQNLYKRTELDIRDNITPTKLIRKTNEALLLRKFCLVKKKINKNIKLSDMISVKNMLFIASQRESV